MPRWLWILIGVLVVLAICWLLGIRFGLTWGQGYHH